MTITKWADLPKNIADSALERAVYFCKVVSWGSDQRSKKGNVFSKGTVEFDGSPVLSAVTFGDRAFGEGDIVPCTITSGDNGTTILVNP